MLFGAILNISLSLLFGLVTFKDTPAIGVSIATSISDLIVLITLFALTWKDSKILLININNLKLLLISILIGVITYFLAGIINNALLGLNMSSQTVYILDIVIMLLIDALIYISLLNLCKEKLTKSIIKSIKK